MAERDFSGRTFKVGKVLATKTMVMQARLLALAGPAIGYMGEIMAGYGENKPQELKDASNLAAIQAFATVFSSAPPAELAAIIKDLCQLTQIRRSNGDYFPTDFDGDFTDYQQDIIPVVQWVLVEVFGDFINGLAVITNQR